MDLYINSLMKRIILLSVLICGCEQQKTPNPPPFKETLPTHTISTVDQLKSMFELDSGIKIKNDQFTIDAESSNRIITKQTQVGNLELTLSLNPPIIEKEENPPIKIVKILLYSNGAKKHDEKDDYALALKFNTKEKKVSFQLQLHMKGYIERYIGHEDTLDLDANKPLKISIKSKGKKLEAELSQEGKSKKVGGEPDQFRRGKIAIDFENFITFRIKEFIIKAKFQ